jgi:hypothetical protein
MVLVSTAKEVAEFNNINSHRVVEHFHVRSVHDHSVIVRYPWCSHFVLAGFTTVYLARFYRHFAQKCIVSIGNVRL